MSLSFLACNALSLHQSHGKPQVDNSHVRRRCSSPWPVGGSGATIIGYTWANDAKPGKKKQEVKHRMIHTTEFQTLPCPPNPVLVNVIQQKNKHKYTALSNTSMLPYVITHIISKGVNRLGRRISSVYSTKNPAGPRLLSSSRWCHPKQLSKQWPGYPGAVSWQSAWDHHGKMEFNLWWRKSYTTSLDWWTNHLNFEVQLTTGIK